MNAHHPFIKFLSIPIIAGFILQVTSCGTLMYPERRGQTSGRIDPAVAVMDGIGIFFFVIPGLIAFAVDFATGAIYLPPGSSKIYPVSPQDAPLHVVHENPDNLNVDTIETIVSSYTGHSIKIDQDTKVSEIKNEGNIPMKIAQKMKQTW